MAFNREWTPMNANRKAADRGRGMFGSGMSKLPRVAATHSSRPPWLPFAFISVD
jgi:hypothetical protein